MSEPGQCNCGEYGGGVHTYSARCRAADKAYCELKCAWKGGGPCLYEYCPRLPSQSDAKDVPQRGVCINGNCERAVGDEGCDLPGCRDVPQRGEKAICVEFVPDADGEYQVDSCVYCGHPRRDHSGDEKHG